MGIWQGVILTIGTFPEPKQHPVNIEHWLKSKLAWPVLQSVHKYDTGALTTTKNGFYLVITWKLLFSSGWTFGGGNKNLVGESWGDLYWCVGGGGGRAWVNFWTMGKDLPLLSQQRRPCCPPQKWKIVSSSYCWAPAGVTKSLRCLLFWCLYC